MKSKCSKYLALVVAVVALAATPAWGAFKVDIGGNIIQDNMGGDLNPLPKFIAYFDAGSGTNFLINFGSSSTNNPFGTLTINNQGTTNGTYPASITIKVTDTGYMLPPEGLDGSFLALALSAVNPGGQGAVGTVESTGYYDPTNTEFGTGAGTTSTATASVGTVTDTDDQVASGGISPFLTPYSLTQVVTVTLTAAGTSTDPTTRNSFQLISNLTVVPVPEPASVAMFGTMLLLTGFTLRKKFSRQ